jgi:hypothetical protein
MGIRGVAPGPDTSKPHPENKIYIEAIAFNNPSIAYFNPFSERTISDKIPSLKICTVVKFK